MSEISNTEHRREIARLLQAAIAKWSWTQTRLAQEMDVSSSTITRWLDKNGTYMPSKLEEERLRQIVIGQHTQLPNKIPGTISLPVFGNIPQGSPRENIEDKIGEVTLPNWVLGGNWHDCYVVKAQNSMEADFAIIKQNHPYKEDDWVVIKIGDSYDFTKMDRFKIKLEIEVVGTVVMIMKVP